MKKVTFKDEQVKFVPKTFRELKSYDLIDFSNVLEEELRPLNKEYLKLPLQEGVFRIPLEPGRTFTDKINYKFANQEKIIDYIYFKKDIIDNKNIIFLEVYHYSPIDYNFIPIFKILLESDTLEIKEPLRIIIDICVIDFVDHEKKKFTKQMEQETINLNVQMFFNFMGYINETLMNKDTIIKTIKKKNISNNAKSITKCNKKSVQILNKDRVLYKISGSDNTIKHFRKYHRHIDSWGVIGHARHYKNGKTVWVKPYTKGKGNERKQKIYKFKESKDDDGG